MDVLMPQLGETVAEGKITKWFKSAGDAVKPGDNLFEIETDKVSMEVPSTTTGVLAEIRVAAGEVAPVGAVVAVISDGSGAASRAPIRAVAAPRAAAAIDPDARPVELLPHGAGRARQPPCRQVTLDPFFEVRTPERNYGPARLAGRHGASRRWRAGWRRRPASISASVSRLGPARPHRRARRRAARAARRAPPAAIARARAPTEVKALYRDVPFEEVPLDGMRRTIATRLVQAKQTIPHFYLTADVEIGRLLAAARGGERGRAEGRGRQARLQALGQRPRHQGLGGGAAARAGRQRGVGGGSHPALQAFRHRRCGRDRRRADHAGDPAGRERRRFRRSRTR